VNIKFLTSFESSRKIGSPNSFGAFPQQVETSEQTPSFQNGGVTMKRIFWGLTCVLLILVLPFGAAAIKDDALVLYLSFDEGKGKTVNDQSGNDNNGELVGDVEWMQKGKMKSAVFFNEQPQQGVVTVKASKSLTITESLTMEVWVYPQSVGDYRNVRGQANPHTYYLSIHQSKPSVWLGTGGAGGKTWNGTNDSIPLNEWSHVAAVYDFDKELLLYINGKLDKTYPVKGKIDSSSSDHWFGNRLDGAWPYKGMLMNLLFTTAF